MEIKPSKAMFKKDDTNTAMMTCMGVVGIVVGCIILFAAVILWNALWSAWATSTIWNEHLRLVFGQLPVMTAHGALAVGALIGWLTRSSINPSKSSTSSDLLASVGYAFLTTPLIAILTVVILQFTWTYIH